MSNKYNPDFINAYANYIMISHILTNLYFYQFHISNIHIVLLCIFRTTACEPVGKNSITEVPLEDNKTYQASGWTRGDFMYQNNLSTSSSIVSTLKFNERRSSEGN